MGLTGFFEFARASLPALLEGTTVTLEIWAWCMLGGTILGLLLALGRVYGNKTIYVLSTGYIELFRGTPMLAQMLFVYFGLPEIGVMLTPVIAASIALGMNTAAYQAEYFRGAIQSIKAGQMVAARSLGMTKTQVINCIVLPQALRIVIPQWSNESILLLKYSSIAFAIGVPELMARAQMIGYSTFRFFDAFLLAALIYLVLTTILAQFLDMLEKRVRIPGREGQ
jgi:polar amino acid transport system permease protein